MPVPSQGHYVFTVFRLLTDFVCLHNYEFWLSLCKIVRSSVILLLPLFIKVYCGPVFYKMSQYIVSFRSLYNICYIPYISLIWHCEYYRLHMWSNKSLPAEHMSSPSVFSGVRVDQSRQKVSLSFVLSYIVVWCYI